MYIWTLIALACLIGFLVFRNSHNRKPTKTKSWNIRFGQLPKHGENQIRYMLKCGIFASVWLIALVTPLLFVSLPPDEGTRFTGDESIVDFAVLIIFFPLSAMAFVAVVGCLLKTILLSLFWRHRVFDKAAGKFVRRQHLSASPTWTDG